MNGVNLRLWCWPAIALWVALSSGCVTAGKQDLPPEEAVQLRAQGWADALMARDVAAAYAFTSPNYRQFASAKAYNVNVAGSSSWTSAVVDSVQCEEDVCDVRVIIEYTLRQYKLSNRRPLDYKWVRVEDEWWLYVPAK